MIKSSLDQLATMEDIEVIWKSYELFPVKGPSLPPAQEAAYRDRVATAWPNTQRIAREHYGLELHHHRWGMKSRWALEGAKFAEEKGLGEPYHEAMFRAHFVEDRDFGNREILADLAEEVGLDRAEFLEAIQNSTYAPPVDADIAQGQGYGLSGVPATIVEGKYLLSGAQPLETLQQVVQHLKTEEEQARKEA